MGPIYYLFPKARKSLIATLFQAYVAIPSSVIIFKVSTCFKKQHFNSNLDNVSSERKHVTSDSIRNELSSKNWQWFVATETFHCFINTLPSPSVLQESVDLCLPLIYIALSSFEWNADISHLHSVLYVSLTFHLKTMWKKHTFYKHIIFVCIQFFQNI